MRNWLRITLTFACVCSGIVVFSKAFAGVTTFHGEIARVVDGDTVHFQDYDADERAKNLKVRMLHIDAPETHLPVNGGVVGQGKWGEASHKHLERLTPVGTETKLVSMGFDKYHRVLGRLYYQNRDVNLKMVLDGWAIPYVICEGPMCTERFLERQGIDKYVEACEDARANGRGIFNPRRPLREMPYEFRLRMQKRRPDKYVGDLETKKLYPPTQMKRVDLCNRIFFYELEDAKRLGFRK